MDIAPAIIIIVVVFSILSSLSPRVLLERKNIYYQPHLMATAEDFQNTKITIKNFITSQTKNKFDETTVDLMAGSIVRNSQENQLDPILVTALIKRESGFSANCVSPSGAIGLGQLKKEAGWEAGVTDLYNIEENIKATAMYLKKMLDLWQNNLDQLKLALASYKEGFGTVSRSGGRYSEHTAGYIADILEICQKLRGKV